MKPLRVDVWSDIACPWCYVGKVRLESAITRLDRAVEVHWRAFELDPGAPRSVEGPYDARLAKKYGVSRPDAERMIDRMTKVAAADGIEMRFDRVKPGNTFDAHRLVKHASARGAGDLLNARFFRGYMSEGEPIGDPAALLRMAIDAGLDAGEVKRVLDSDAFAGEVRADEREAVHNGITGVPFYVVADRYGISGAQPADALLKVLAHAAAEPARPQSGAAVV